MGAIACYRQALKLDPKDGELHSNLGNLLAGQGDLSGAITCYKKALDLDSKLTPAHLGLGQALHARGDLAGAITSYRKALQLDPKLAQGHGALGQALLAQGDFKAARAATQRALELLPPGHSLRSVVTRQLQVCQRLLDLEARLTAICARDEQPKGTAEQLALADLCQRYQKRYTAAARFYSDAFAAGAAQTTSRAYNAACAAVLAADGKGVDADKLDVKEKTRLRHQALTWLRDNLKEYAKQLADADAKSRQAVQQTLQNWQKNPDFDSVRGEEALAKLPEAECTAWQQLWADVDKLLQKTRESTK
jgi:tetratricopeptide (TPR) repeat protein